MAERDLKLKTDDVGVPVFPGNSHKEKEEKKQELSEKKEKVKIAQVANGKKQKETLGKKFKKMFFKDTDDVGEYLLQDVIIPAAKNVITDAITGALQMILYGDNAKPTGMNRRNGRSTYTSYGRYYQERGYQEPRRRETKPICLEFDNIIVDTRHEAEIVLRQLDDQISVYSMATVADFYDALGLETEYTDNKYGWRDLRGAYVNRVRDGYGFVMPKAEYLD